MPLTTASEPPFGDMARQMSKMLDHMHKGYYNPWFNDTWTPSVNLYETELAYVVCVDLAGVDKDKIEIVISEGKMKLKGTRAVPIQPTTVERDPHGKRVRVHLMEIDHGGFCRDVELPHDVLHERVVATYKDGLLWIELPKK